MTDLEKITTAFRETGVEHYQTHHAATGKFLVQVIGYDHKNIYGPTRTSLWMVFEDGKYVGTEC
jgi:D-mannonate dehydratase